jgi:hypothetical protein
MKLQLDSQFVQALVEKHRPSDLKVNGGVWGYVGRIMPHVLMELQALGTKALIHLGPEHARIRLGDGNVYKVKYSHAAHALLMVRVVKGKNQHVVATFTNDTDPLDVWAALNPAKASW